MTSIFLSIVGFVFYYISQSSMGFKSPLLKVKKGIGLLLNPKFIPSMLGKVKYIFIISHMRSRSSVLSHVLGSNLDICGYSELHISYLGRNSLLKMRFKLFNQLKSRLKGKFLLDKLLHKYSLSSKVIKISKPRIIFLVREPESTIKSIINMGYVTAADAYKDPIVATEYYCTRLTELEEFAKKIEAKAFLVISDDLVDHTSDVLADLTNWLELKTPLAKEYNLFSDTGKFNIGDPLPNIKSGVLKKTEGYPDITIPQELLERAQASFLKCTTTLERYVKKV